MIEISSNSHELEAEFLNSLDDFGFTSPTSSGESVGEACARTVAEMIHASDAVNPDGTPWPDNKEPYKGEKAKKYGSDTTGFRTGQMLSVASLLGTPTVGHDETVMAYGTGQPPTQGEDGLGFDPKEDGHITDREKAEYFTEKVGEFYSLNPARDEAVSKVIIESFAEHTRNHFGGSP